MVIAQIINQGVRFGTRYFKQLHKLDVSIHKGLYGASAGRGVRHGRDIGIFSSQLIQESGDEGLDAVPFQPGSRTRYQTRSKYQTYRRDERPRNTCRCKRNRFNRYR